jgi:hypothetical protein
MVQYHNTALWIIIHCVLYKVYNTHILVDASKYWPQQYFSIHINKHLNAGIESDYVFFDEVVLFLMYIICKKKEGKKKGNVQIFIYNGVVKN